MTAFTFTAKVAIRMPAARVENVIVIIVQVGKEEASDFGEIELEVVGVPLIVGVGETVTVLL